MNICVCPSTLSSRVIIYILCKLGTDLGLLTIWDKRYWNKAWTSLIKSCTCRVSPFQRISLFLFFTRASSEILRPNIPHIFLPHSIKGLALTWYIWTISYLNPTGLTLDCLALLFFFSPKLPIVYLSSSEACYQICGRAWDAAFLLSS